MWVLRSIIYSFVMITTIKNYHIFFLSLPLPPCVCACVHVHVCVYVCVSIRTILQKNKAVLLFWKLMECFLFCHLSCTNLSFGFKIWKIIVSKHNSQSDLLPSNFLQICALFPLKQKKNEKFLIPFFWIQMALGNFLCKFIAV